MPYCPSQDAPFDRRVAFPRDQRDAETGRMTDEVFVRTTIAKREHQMLMAEQQKREDLRKAENMVAIEMAENRATAAEMVSAIECREEIKAAESKAARDVMLRQIRSQRAYTTLGPSVGANNPTMVEATLLCNAGRSLRPENSQDPSSVEKIESESPVSLEYSDSRNGQNRIRCPRTDAGIIYTQGAPPPNSQQHGGMGKTTYDRVGDKTGRDDDDHHNKAKVKSDARERGPTELERRNPIQSNDEDAKGQHKRIDEMVRQSLNRIERYNSGTQITTTPTRTYMQAVSAHPEAPVEQVVKKEKTTLGSRRGSSNDPKSQTGERNKDDRESNRRRPRDRLPQENRYNGRREDRKRDHGDDNYGGGDDDDPRHGKDKNKQDVKK
jgi:hypothetical protein